MKGERKKAKNCNKRQTKLNFGSYWDLNLLGVVCCTVATLFHSAKGKLPPPLLHIFSSLHPVSAPRHGQRCTALPATVCPARSATTAIPTALATAFTFSLHWQRYRQTAVENNGYCQFESDILFNWQENAQGWLWALLSMRFELPTMTLFKFSLIPAQVLIGNSSDLTMFPNVKSYCSKTFAFALLVVIQSMLYVYIHVHVLHYFLLINLYITGSLSLTWTPLVFSK